MSAEDYKMETEENSWEEDGERSGFPGIFDYLRSSYKYGSSSSIVGSWLNTNTNRDSSLHNTDRNNRRVISRTSTISLPSSTSTPTTNHLIPDPYFPSSTEQLQMSHNDEQLGLEGNETVFDEGMVKCYSSLHNEQSHSTNHQWFDEDVPSIRSTDASPTNSNEDLSNEIPRLFSSRRVVAFHSEEKQLDHLHQEDLNNSLICIRNWDGVLCWPDTPAGITATLPCFDKFYGIAYDTSKNATRYCGENGSWENRSDYSSCLPSLKESPPMGDGDNLEITTRVYFYGYCLSLCALTIAMAIFLVFKELRCLRNTIHTHLIITYILSDAMWIVTSSTTLIGQHSDSSQNRQNGNQVSCVTFILLHYFHLTNFFWMFVEGLYLYVLVVLTFVTNIKLRIYASVGWGVPLLVVIGWAIAKWLTQSATIDIQATDPEFNVSTCLWLTVNLYDWIYKAPAILVLASNMIFLLQIMWVLITKLRSATNPETQQSRKAAKALVVLMPLLGITYVLVLTGSKTAVYEYLRALLISTQGFLVALLYCFLNGEVRIALRHRWNRIRTLGPELSCCDGDRREQVQHTRDWRSRTESLRLYDTSRTHSYRKRDSSVCETTLTTLHNNGNAGNGGGLMGRRLSTNYGTTSQKFYTTVATKEENESIVDV